MSRVSSASAMVVAVAVSASALVGACAPATPEARAAMMERAHTPAERVEHTNRVRAYQAALRAH